MTLPSSRRLTRKTLPSAFARHQDWVEIDLGSLDAREAERASRWMKALSTYLDGRPVAELLRAMKSTHGELLRLLNRCIEFGDDGQLWGWRALIPNACRIGYTRKAPVVRPDGCSGALAQLFAGNPGIKIALDTAIRGKSTPYSIREACIRPKDLHRLFISECKRANVGPDNWPFNTTYEGRRTIDRYLRRALETADSPTLANHVGEVAASKRRTGTGKERFDLARAPFDVAEMDPHRIDLIGAVGLPTPLGIKWLPIERLQLILICDVASQCVIGYAVAIRRECDSFDVLLAARCLTQPWKPREITLSSMSYAEGAGLPNGVIEGLEAVGIGVLKVDNALVLKSKSVVERFTSRLGCAVNWGPVRHWERRPIVERIGGLLQQSGFQRVICTTGASPTDPRRKNPTAKAIKYRMQVSILLDLIDISIAGFNVTESEGCFGLSRLDVIRQAIDGTGARFFTPHLPDMTARVPDLEIHLVTAVIRGSVAKGRRPYITYHRARYTNPVLARSSNLIGTKVTLHVPHGDIRVIRCFLPSGEALGALIVMGPWAKTPHSLEDRQLINSGIAKAKIDRQHDEDPVAALHRGLGEEALREAKKKKAPKVSKSATTLSRSLARSGAPMPTFSDASPDRPVATTPVLTTRRAPRLTRS